MSVTLDDLRRDAVARTLFRPVTLDRAIEQLGFVQADPIRAPARAQDLVLRHRVAGYHAGDLERIYPALDVEEDVFINYGIVSRAVHRLMHPRLGAMKWPPSRRKRAEDLLAFVRSRQEVHPREVDAHFAHGRVTNYWGGSSSATTHLMEQLQYWGLLRVARRERGVRIYAVGETADPISRLDRRHDVGRGLPAAYHPAPAARERVDALIDVLVRKYGPVPRPTLAFLVARLRFAVPQWRRDLKPALLRAKARLSHARVADLDWYWPAGEALASRAEEDAVRLLAPFDPVVWDRRRFELLWNWSYRFEAYTPVRKRKLGYYALPLLWRNDIVGWATASVDERRRLKVELGFAKPRPRSAAFTRALDAEIERMRAFLGLP